MVASQEGEFEPPVDGPSRIGVVWAMPGTMPPRFPAQTPNRLSSYVYIQERKRENGPPAWFTTGSQASAGTCTVWTGQYPDGARWLGLSRDNITLLVTTNALSAPDLLHYVATRICA